jgi:hypothetical protein
LRALRFFIGAAFGFVVWWYATLFYDGALSFAAERILQLDHRLCNAHLVADERKVEVTPHLCVAPTATIPADQLTYNMILFGALFAMRFRSFQSFFAALFVLVITHILSLVLSIEATYAARLGSWSNAHYGGLESDFWVGAEFWWRIVGMLALVFVMWWLTLEPTAQPVRESAAPRPKRAAAKGRR